MDFFAAQASARRRSQWLLLWLLVAVVAIIATVYLALVAVIGRETTAGGQTIIVPWQPQLLLSTITIVGGFILLGSLYKVLRLSRDGGAQVARELGGRALSRESTDPLERRLLNVVDEMAIAAGLPAPPVFVLDHESSINAFAAGLRTTEGVVAVTRGALERLDRDELQGVIAHEFSHILNGDMRLNLRLMGLLHGILLLALTGRMLMRGGAESGDKAAIPLILGGLLLVIVGYVGVLCAKLIKAAVSRQREFLADAAAVQFTRNPVGLKGALEKIAGLGSALRHPRAESASHMMFGSGLTLGAFFATHPPVVERLRRLDPRAHDEYRVDDSGPVAANHSAGSGISAAQAFVASVGQLGPQEIEVAHQLVNRIPADICAAARSADAAPSLILALLIDRDATTGLRQLAHVEAQYGVAAREACAAHAAWLQQAGVALRLPLLDLALPTLHALGPAARDTLLASLDALIGMDGKTGLFEFVLRHLIRERPNRTRRAHASPARIQEAVQQLIALLAQLGSRDEAVASAAFAAGIAVAPIDGPSQAPEVRLGAAALDAQLDLLEGCAPAFQRRILQACATTVFHDAQVTPAEAELMRAIARSLDCPVPPDARYASA